SFLYVRKAIMNTRVIEKISAYHPSVPVPVIFTVRRRMDADKAAPRLDIPLQRHPLPVIQYIARGTQEDHCGIFLQTVIHEPVCIRRRIDVELVRGPQFLDSGIAIYDRGVMESHCFTKDKDSGRTGRM